MHARSRAGSTKRACRWTCASGGELAVALHAGFPAERIALHGNNKSVAELTAAVKAGVGHVVLDSMTEIDRLDEIAGAAGVVQDVLVRVTVGVEAHTHEFISTAHEDQKFGLSLASGAAMDAVRRVFAADNLRLVGLHSHIGSQIFDVDGFELAAHRVIGLLRDVVAEFGVEKTAQMSHRRPRRRPRHLLLCPTTIRRRWTTSPPSSAPSCAASPPRSACPRRNSWSSPAARSPAPAPSRSTRSAPSRTSPSARRRTAATSASTAA